MIRIIDAHVAGQAVRLIVDGVELPAGRRVIDRHQAAGEALDRVRQLVLWEPRGHADLIGAMLTPADDPMAQAGVLVLDGDGLLPLSGTAIMAVATIALDRHLLVAGHGTRRLTIETAAGLVPVAFDRTADGTVGRVTVSMPPSAVLAGGAAVRWGQQLVRVDLVLCGDGLHAIVDAESAGVGLITLDRKAVVGLAGAVNRHIVANRTARPLTQVLLTGPAGDEADLRIVPVTPGGRVRRSPSAGGSAAVVTVLDAMGFVPDDRPLVLQGPAGATFEARIASRVEGGAHPVVQVDVAGEAWIIGEATLIVDGGDPLGEGFVI